MRPEKANQSPNDNPAQEAAELEPPGIGAPEGVSRIAPTGAQQQGPARREVEQGARISAPGAGVAPGRLPRGRSARLALVLAVALAGLLGYGGYWYIFLQGVISTDDAYVDAAIVSVSSRLAGRAAAVRVKEGDRVVVGQPLVELARELALLRRAEALAEVHQKEAKHAGMLGPARREVQAVTEAQMAMDEVVLARRERSVMRLEALSAVRAVTRKEIEDARAEAEQARAKLEMTRRELELLQAGATGSAIRRVAAELELARARLRTVEADLASLTVKSPIDGVVARRMVEPGEVVQPGQGLVQVVETGKTWVVANLEEGQLGGLQEGQAVEVSVDAYPGRTLRGRVGAVYGATLSRFSVLSTTSSSGGFIKVTQRIPVRIEWAERQIPPMYPGMNVVVRIFVRP